MEVLILFGLVVLGFLWVVYDFWWLRKDAKKDAKVKIEIQNTNQFLEKIGES